MATLSFSPPASDVADRATSPALSSSSRTTTSLPTDLSDVSSLSDGEYEVVDPPEHAPRVFCHQNHAAVFGTAGDDRDEEDDANDLGHSAVEGVSGSSFIVVDDSNTTSSSSRSRSSSQAQSGSSNLEDGSSTIANATPVVSADAGSRPIRSSNSVETLQRSTGEGDWDASCSSSQLRFPDPLEESFQQSSSQAGDLSQESACDGRSIVDKADEESHSQDVASSSEIHGAPHDVQMTGASPEAGKMSDDELSEKPCAPLDESRLRSLTSGDYAFALPAKLGPYSVFRHGWRVGVTVLAIAIATGALKGWTVSLGNRWQLSHIDVASHLNKSSPTVASISSSKGIYGENASTRVTKAVATMQGVMNMSLPASSSAAKCHSPPRTKSLSVVERGSRDLSVYLTGSKALGENIAIWIGCRHFTTDTLFTPCEAPTWLASGALSHIPQDVAIGVSGGQLRARALRVCRRHLGKPSRNARSLYGTLHNDWTARTSHLRRRCREPPNKYSDNDAAKVMRKDAGAALCTSLVKLKLASEHNEGWCAQLVATLQKSWAVWLIEIGKALEFVMREAHLEFTRFKRDAHDAWRLASERAASHSKEAQVALYKARRKAARAARSFQKHASQYSEISNAWHAATSATVAANTKTQKALQKAHENARKAARELLRQASQMKDSSVCRYCTKGDNTYLQRLQDIDALRSRHRALMSLLERQKQRQEQAWRTNPLLATSIRAKRLIDDAKVTVLKGAIRAGQAKIIVDDTFHKLSPCKTTAPRRSCRDRAVLGSLHTKAMRAGQKAQRQARRQLELACKSAEQARRRAMRAGQR